MATPIGLALETLRDALSLLSGDEYGTGCNLTRMPCRVALYPSGSSSVPWDSCGESRCGADSDGQLWAAFSGITETSPSPAGDPCRRFQWTGEVGIVRCEKASPGDGGQMPDPALVEADADRQATDADLIFNALVCCTARPERLRDLALTAWTPLGPSGGCVGGLWTVRGVLDVCC